MKNPILLFFLWLLFFFLEVCFPWELGRVSIRPFGSTFVLGYAFFVLPFFSSLLFGAAVFFIQSSYSQDPFGLLFLIVMIYLAVFWVRRKTFSENLGAQAITVFIAFFFGAYLLEVLKRGGFYAPPLSPFASLLLLGQLGFNFAWAIFLFWFLEEPGSIWEERLFSFRAKRGQLHLFEARHLRGVRQSRFKIQRRVRRRFGLKESW